MAQMMGWRMAAKELFIAEGELFMGFIWGATLKNDFDSLFVTSEA